MSDIHLARGFTLPLDVVTEAVGIVATRGAGKSFTAAVILEEAHAAKVPFVVIDPNGVFNGLRSNAAGDGPGLPVYVLGGPHGDLPLEPTAGKLIADLVVDSGHSFVLDLSDLLTKAAARQFVADFLEHLHRRKARARTTLLLVVDEADEFAPQNPRGETARSLGAMETIAKRGRAWGLGIVMITQRTQALNKDVLDLIETLIAMRQLSERSRAAVKGWIADKDLRDDSGVIESLQSLPTGTAWVWSPLRGMLQKVQVRRIRTFDSYATPKPGESRQEPSARTELDLDALGEQMQATVQRAKDSDPKELQKRIRDLEARLLTAEHIEVGQTVEVLVEVPVPTPVVDETQLARLTNMQESLSEALGSITALAVKIGETVAIPPPVIHAPVRRESPAPVGNRPVQKPVTPYISANGVTAPEQKVLDALGWFEAMGIGEPTRIQTGFVAGYKVSKKGGGTFAQIIADMTRTGLIEQGRGSVRLTEHGRSLAQDPGLGRTNEAMHSAVLDRLPEPERKILRELLLHYPDAVNRIDLGAATGYTVTAKGGGTFAQLLANLKTLGLIDYPRPAHVAALAVLYPMGGK